MIVFNPFTGAFDYVSDPATTTAKGVVKLANHLGGTALLPTVVNFTLSGDASANSHKITSLLDGTGAGDAVNLGQLTAAVEGRQNKDPAMWGTTGNITLSGFGTQANGEWTGTLTAGTRILVKSQSASADDGVYLAASGAWTRSLDTNTGAEITNASVLVLLGATLTGDTFTQTNTVATIGTDAQMWTQTGEGATYTADGTSVTLTGATFSRNALTGDITASAGSSATILKNTGPGATGPIGSASTTPVVTIDAQGRTTALTSATITPAAIGAPSGSGTHTGTSSGTNTGDQTTSNSDGTITVATGASNPVISRPAITGDATIAGGSNASVLATVNSNTGSFGTASNVGQFSVNGKGLTTAAANVPIQIAESQVTNLVADLAATAQYTPQRPASGFTVPLNTQIMFGIDIDMQAANGDLTINGVLQGVH